MKKNNSLTRGNSFLDNFFPFWAVDDDEIQSEDERIAAAAAAAENIDNHNKKEASASTGTKDAGGTGSTGGAGTVNIGSINIGGDVHVHMDTDRSRRNGTRSSRNDDVIDVDFVDVTDRTTAPKKPAPTPTPTRQRLTLNESKQELTKDIRMGDFDALQKLDQMIESRDIEKLIELFSDNRPLCLWIKRTTQKRRWNQLPVIVQELVNQQL